MKKSHSKNIQKGSGSFLEDVIRFISRAVEKEAPSLIRYLPDESKYAGKLPSNELMQEILTEKIMEYPGKKTESYIEDQHQKKMAPKINANVKIINEISSTPNLKAQQEKISNQIFSDIAANQKTSPNKFVAASQIKASSAKKFVASTGAIFDSPITPKQISSVFDDDAVLSIMATSKTTSDLSHKIKAGLVLDKLTKNKYTPRAMGDKFPNKRV